MYQVFRIEHRETKLGPFQTHTEFTQQLAKKATNNSSLILPFQDGLIFSEIPWFYVFGCLDLGSLKGWFCLAESQKENNDILKNLDSLGFHLAEFLVEEECCYIGKSKQQIMFDADSCRDEGLVEYHSISMLSH